MPLARGIVAVGSLVQVLDHLRLQVRRCLKIAENILDQNDRGIDDDAEVDRTHRQQVRVLALQHQQNDGEEQRKRNVDADNDRAAQIAQEDPLDQEHQQAAENQIVQHRVSRDADQGHAVVEGHDLDSRRKGAVVVHRVDFAGDSRHDLIGVGGAARDDDRHCHVIVMVLAHDAGPRDVAHVHPGYVLDQHRRAIALSEHDIFDVRDVAPLGDIVGTAVVDEPDAADVRRLLADGDLAPADVDVGIAQGRHELWNRYVISLKLVGVGLDL